MKYLYPIAFGGRQAAENPDETMSLLGIIWFLIKAALLIAITAAIFAIIVAGITKLFGKDFEEWLKGSFVAWIVLLV